MDTCARTPGGIGCHRRHLHHQHTAPRQNAWTS